MTRNQNMHPLLALQGKKRLHVCGLMTGTSVDAIDSCLVRLWDRPGGLGFTILGSGTTPLPPKIRRELRSLGESPSAPDSIDQVCRLDRALGELLGRAALACVDGAGLPRDQLHVVASHGQTIRHRPRARPIGDVPTASTLQIGDPGVIAERTCAVVVSHFRNRDMAAGGQGAPLVSGAEIKLLGSNDHPIALQNLGGIGNVTFLPGKSGTPLAFDTGPANMPLDELMRQLSGGRRAYDKHGRLARSGTADERMLKRLMRHPYLMATPPKSAGREEFGATFVADLLDEARTRHMRNADLMATLVSFIASSISRSYARFLHPYPGEVYLSGGGVSNPALVDAIRSALAPATVSTTIQLGIPPETKEALAFAVLGYETVRGRPTGCPWATGAGHPVIQGSVTY